MNRERAAKIVQLTTDFINNHILHSESKIKLVNMVLDLYIVDDPVTNSPATVKVWFFASIYCQRCFEMTFSIVANKVVEINPFAEFAGGGLFSWVDDKLVTSLLTSDVITNISLTLKTKSREVLFGRKPFEFRFVEAERKFQVDTISADWRPFVYPK